MKITRIIHPVGQGGFYSETLNDGSNEIHVIYDCGGNSSSLMQNYMDDYFPGNKKQEIDAVFISHLHNDHINGLEYLLRNYRVKYLFLPQLTQSEILEVLLYNSINTGSGENPNMFVLDLYNSDNGYFYETRIIRVAPDDGEHGHNEDNNRDYDFIEDRELLKNITKITSGTRLRYRKEWLFIPYNPPVLSKNINVSFYEFFIDELGLDWFELKDLAFIVHKIGIDKCKEVYENYFGKNHNSYSMTLFSGIDKSHPFFDDRDDLFHDIMKCFSRYYFSPNCLYTGDFDTKNQFINMRSFYAPFWETIRSIQVPHHGSRNNHDERLYEFADRCFISVGEKNNHRHPNIDTLIGISKKGCDPVIVTERLSSLKMYHFSI